MVGVGVIGLLGMDIGLLVNRFNGADGEEEDGLEGAGLALLVRAPRRPANAAHCGDTTILERLEEAAVVLELMVLRARLWCRLTSLNEDTRAAAMATCC